MARSDERAARNESVFREANEKLRQGRDSLAAASDRTPFLCECEDTECTATMLLTVDEYERGRQSGDCFLIIPEHEDRTHGETLAREDHYLLVRKLGAAGEIARGLDPRT
jgi:hypothetical protein